jgi:hypothetical protein
MSETRQQVHIFVSSKVKNTLTRRAKEEHRTITSYITHLIMQDAKYAKLPVRRVDDLGEYDWDTPEGMKEAAERR